MGIAIDQRKGFKLIFSGYSVNFSFLNYYPLDTGRILNVHKTFNLDPMPRG